MVYLFYAAFKKLQNYRRVTTGVLLFCCLFRLISRLSPLSKMATMPKFPTLGIPLKECLTCGLHQKVVLSNSRNPFVDLPSMHCGQHAPGTWPGFLPYRKKNNMRMKIFCEFIASFYNKGKKQLWSPEWNGHFEAIYSRPQSHLALLSGEAWAQGPGFTG